MPTLNLGRVGFVNKGTWLISTAYKINDTVTYLGGTYAALQANTGQTPILGGTIYWQEWIANNVVHTTGNESIDGIKTFTSSPIVPDATTAFQPLTFGQTSAKLATDIHSATAKTTPVNADEFALSDSEATFGLKKITFANLKAGIGAAKQIQPITASVAANELTVTLNATSLDFRSSTLGSGTVNTRTIASPISMTVSSGSTLGTVSATASRLALIAIDNAGTVELAITNISGNLNLDETTLISTTAEGGAGAADSASVIYSTSARTNVPFRVVGFIDITEATAGTWVTAPSTIQGEGGNNITNLTKMVLGTSVASISGTSIDFTAIPSWVKKVTIMLDGVSTSGTSNMLIQLGDSGGIEITGYVATGITCNSNIANTGAIFTTGIPVEVYNPYVTAAGVRYGQVSFKKITGNTWVANGEIATTLSATSTFSSVSGTKTLSAILDRVRITTVGGTDTFDAGLINIMYEG